MKNLVLFVLIVICYQCSIAQSKRVLDIVNIQLPNGARQVADLKTFYKAPDTPSFPLITSAVNSENIYQFERILIKIDAKVFKMHKDFLKSMDDTFSGFKENKYTSIYESSTKVLSNVTVLINHYEFNDESFGYYAFTGVSIERGKLVSGSIQYHKNDRAKAKKVLDAILATLKFK